jgi:asparagine synthetase A
VLVKNLSNAIYNSYQTFDLKKEDKDFLTQIIQNKCTFLNNDDVRNNFPQLFPLIEQLYAIAKQNKSPNAALGALNLT